MIQNKYFEWSYENPFTTYSRIKKFFLPLTTKWNLQLGKGVAPAVFGFEARDVRYQDIDGQPHHTSNPFINISLFNIIHLTIEFTTGKGWKADDAYWEAAINWVVYKQHLPKSLDLAGNWMSDNSTTDEWKESKAEILQNPWQSLYNNKKLLKIMYEDTF